MLYRRIACYFGSHAPSRSYVNWIGGTSQAPCRSCGRELRRDVNGKWRVSDK